MDANPYNVVNVISGGTLRCNSVASTTTAVGMVEDSIPLETFDAVGFLARWAR